MNMVNEQVKHDVFGTGTVHTVEQGYIVVQFAGEIGRKTFLYPDAFEHYLTLCSPSAQGSIKRELDDRMLDGVAAQAEKEHLKREEEARREKAHPAPRKTPQRAKARAKK